MKGYPTMNVFSRSGLVVPLVSALSLFALPAQAQDQNSPRGQAQQQAKPQVQATKPPGGRPPAAVAGRGAPTTRVYGGNPYRGRTAWEGGRWRHEAYRGRDGWWWDVGGVRYYYAEPMEGPPTYISEDYVDDVGYPPPPTAYYPPPPPPDPGASAVGGAIVGGLLGGLLTGRAEGAAVGAIAGGATGAIAGATAAARPGYYWSQGTCYYRYPSGQYVPADERACY
jgi:hypothetical protein